jgi:hypothetical protein
MPPTQPSTADRYSRVADLYKRALAEADQSDDPAGYRARAQAAYDKKVRQIAESEQASRQAAPARPAAAAAPPARKSPSPSATAFALKTGVSPESLPEARMSPRVLNVLSGIPVATEVAGLITKAVPGGMSYQQGRQAAARKFREAEKETGGFEAAVERAMPMAVATRGMSLLPMAASTVAGEAVRGVSEAGTGEGEEAPTIRERLGAAAGTGGVAGAGIAAVEGALRAPKVLRPVARAIGRKFPNARDVVEGIGEGVASVAQRPLRAASTALQERAPAVEAFMAQQGVPGAGAGVRRLAEMIEPRDMTRIMREAEQRLPGRPGAAPVGRLQQQAERATATAEAERMAAKQAAEVTTTIGKGRAARLTQASETATAASKAAQEQAEANSKAAAEQALGQIKSEAQAAVGGMRVMVRGTARRLQQTIRNTQLKEGNASYKLVREMGAPPQPDVGLHLEILDDPQMRNLYGDVTRQMMREARNAPTGEGPMFRNIRVGNEDMTELTLEGMDLLRRRLLEPQFRKDPNVAGLSASAKREMLERVNRMEERFLAGYGDDAAAQTLKNAREPYREKFVLQQSILDGLSLGLAKTTRPGGVLAPDRRQLDEVVERVAEMTPEQRAAFQVGAKEWFDRVVQETPEDALKIAQKFIGNEASRRRLALAYGDGAVATLQAFAPSAVATRTAAAGKAAEVSQASTLAEQLATRAQRAEALSARALQQATERAQVVSPRVAQAAQEAEQAQFLAGVPFEQVLGGGQAAETFRTLLAPRIRPDVRTGVLGSLIQDEIRGMNPAQAIRYLESMQQNPAVMQEFGGSIRTLLQDLQRPGPVRTGAQRARVLLTGQGAGNLFTPR